MERFENKWSNHVKFATAFTIFMFIGVSYFICFESWDINGMNVEIIKIVLSFYIIVLFCAVLFFCWYFSVKEYIINEEGIVLVKPFNKVLIVWDDVFDIVRISKDDLKNSIRLWGNGGIFGFYGYFKNRILGKYKGYFADFNNLVLIKKKDGTNILISPFNSDFFIEYAKKFIRK